MICVAAISCTPMTNKPVTELTKAQRDRLAFIEMRLWFLGEIRRQVLIERFGIQSAAATRDLTLYRALAPGNIDYDGKAKVYVTGSRFSPLFQYAPDRILTWLAQGFGDGEPSAARIEVVCDYPGSLAAPDLETLSSITRAIHLQCPLQIDYFSLSSGKTQREILPFALIDTGMRWHVRAFDRRRQQFRDFVISRIQNPQLLKDHLIEFHESSNQDIQWARQIELELVPHPDQPYPEITEMDYRMSKGIMRVSLRAATAGYTLRKWCVDCSADHSLRGAEYRLWLKNAEKLEGIDSAALAPGYLAEGAE